jgi:hypothetical protein
VPGSLVFCRSIPFSEAAAATSRHHIQLPRNVKRRAVLCHLDTLHIDNMVPFPPSTSDRQWNAADCPNVLVILRPRSLTTRTSR